MDSQQLFDAIVALSEDVKARNQQQQHFEALLEVEIKSIRKDYNELKHTMMNLATEQKAHSERITAGEVRMSDLQALRTDVQELGTKLHGLEIRVNDAAQPKAHWSAIASPIIAVVAVLFGIFQTKVI